MADREDVLLKFFESAREEIMDRVRYRDAYLKLQLLVQTVLLALASGVKVLDVEAINNRPDLLIMSLPISLVLALSYNIEDRLIGFLSDYCANLRIAGLDCSWDNSEPIRNYAMKVAPIRFSLQVLAFIIVPLMLFLFNIYELRSSKEAPSLLLLSTSCISAILIGVVLVKGFQHRRKTGSSHLGKK